VENGISVEIGMDLTNEISLQVIKDASEFKQSECEVLHNNNMTGVKVSGQVLEASIKVDNKLYLLFTTDNVIFEESLNIFLIQFGKDSKVIDSATIGEMYSTGIFKDLRIRTEDSLEFYFMGDSAWRLTVYRKPQIKISFINENRRVSRPVGFKRYFSVSEAE